MLCVSMLGVHCVGASEEDVKATSVTDNKGNYLGKGELDWEGGVIKVKTKPVISKNLYKYKNRTDVHVYFTLDNVRYSYDKSSEVVPAKSSICSGCDFIEKIGVDIMAVTSTHNIWKSGNRYKSVIHQ